MAKIKMTTDRDIKERILNAISIFFSCQCFEIIIFLSKATSTDAVAALEEVSVWWTVVVFTQHSATFKIEITQPSTGLWYLKQDNQPHLESMFLKEIAVRELLFESTVHTISQLFGLDEYSYVTDFFFNFIKIPMKVFQQLRNWLHFDPVNYVLKSQIFYKKQNFIRTYLFQS